MNDTESGEILKRQIFVAYSYRDYPAGDYRRVFEDISKEYSVSFVFADEKITNMHIMQKIISYIRASDFSLFDISGWNPNVTLELGIAMATGDDWYIAFNPAKTDVSEVPSDLRGIDRVQYSSYSELGERLRLLVEQRYAKRATSVDDFVGGLQESILELLKSQPGLTIKELAELTGSTVPVLQVVIRPLLDAKVTTTGKTRGMKYYPIAAEPKP